MTKKDTKKPILKPVSFTANSETDLEILKFIEENNLAFSSYVKDLITSDMKKLQEKNEIVEAINNLTNAITNVISNNSLTITHNHVKNENNTIDEEKKNIIGNILNMSK